MKYLIAVLIVIAVIMASTITIVSVAGSGDSHIQVVPLGRVTEHDGTTKYEVALTNQNSFRLLCIVGPTTVTTAADGTLITNFLATDRIELEPKAGTNIAVTPPSESAAWTLTVAHEKLLSDTGIYLRGLAARLHLCKFSFGFKTTSIEIKK